VTSQVSVQLVRRRRLKTCGHHQHERTIIDTHLLAIVAGLPSGVTVDARKTTTGKPYYRVFFPNGG